MNKAAIEFNQQLAIDVLVNGLTEITEEYVNKFAWSNFDEVVIPEGITCIGFFAFYDLGTLKTITIPDSVTRIRGSAFQYCKGLTNITIPDSVTEIGLVAFDGCKRLTNITFKGKTLDEVKAMKDYPWGILDPENISVQVD